VITALLLFVAERLLHVERFTLYSDSGKEIRREQRMRQKERRMREKYDSSPQNRIYGYEPKRMRSGIWLIVYHLLLPVSVLSFFQTPALIYPLIDYLRSGRVNAIVNEISTSVSDISGTANLVMKFLADLMQTKEFIFSMSLGYILLIAVYIFIITRIEKQPLSSSGLPLKGSAGVKRALIAYGKGLLIGLGMMSLAVAAMLLTGNLRITGFGIDPSGAVLFAAYIAMWIPQGASEEIMFRGYMLPRISRRFGRAFAVFFTSAAFALLHGANAGVTPLAVINLVLIAMFFAELSLFTGNIWTVSAAHSVWNFAQGNLFGLRVSGTQNTASLLHTAYGENASSLLTGGDFGPEGGLIVTGVTVLCLLLLFVLRHKLKSENL
jgi:membrane protease YdiL (CAAX protease family)